jgi:hypothetical protein
MRCDGGSHTETATPVDHRTCDGSRADALKNIAFLQNCRFSPVSHIETGANERKALTQV